MPNESAEHLAAYAPARSCLVTLARRSSPSTAVTFDELLFALDELHGGCVHSAYPLVASRADLLEWLEVAARRLIAGGGDAGGLELILAVAKAV